MPYVSCRYEAMSHQNSVPHREQGTGAVYIKQGSQWASDATEGRGDELAVYHRSYSICSRRSIHSTTSGFAYILVVAW